MSENDYAALANTIKIEEITSDEHNQTILCMLKNNREDFDTLEIKCLNDNKDSYAFSWAEDTGWLGYYIGNSTKLRELHFYNNKAFNHNNESFYEEMSRNKSIQEFYFRGENTQRLLDGDKIRMLGPFFKNNTNLTRIEIEFSVFGAESMRQLSLAIGGCSKSLQRISITCCEFRDGNIVDIITALSMHPQLTELCLTHNEMTMGNNECTALSTLLRCTTIQLQKLDLSGNNIDDEGVESLVNAIGVDQLNELDLSANDTITIRGWTALSTLLERSDSSLTRLALSNNNIRNDGFLVFANALKKNSTLKVLDMSDNIETSLGWGYIFNLLCNTSSVNNTYLSNHTLECVGIYIGPNDSGIFIDIAYCMGLNKYNAGDDNIDEVAMMKIMEYHSHFDMQPFFEWEFKVLPLMINWFANAVVCNEEWYTKAQMLDEHHDENIEKKKIKMMKLSVIYDFITEFPMLYVEPITRKEIADYTAMEDGPQGGELEEIRQRKARAMRRLS